MDYRELQEKLCSELREIKELRKRVKNSLKGAPTGTLWCDVSKGKHPQYYLTDKKTEGAKRERTYLKRSEIHLARRLAQKEYDEKFLNALEKQERVLGYVQKNYRETMLGDVYDRLSQGKKKLITPYVPTDEMFVEDWIRNHEGKKNSFPFSNVFTTEKGEMVRSKSEKMIADKLYYLGIPYQYETSLLLADGRMIYPDFAILNMRTRKTFFLEHFGMMDQEEYCIKALEKVERYQLNGIFPGETLLITTETGGRGLDMKQVEMIIEHYLK